MRSIEGTPRSLERDMVVDHGIRRARSGNTVGVPTRFAAARSRRQSAGFEFPSRGSDRFAVGDEVEQDHRLGVLVTGRRGSASAQAGRVEVARCVTGRLLAVEEDEDDRGAKLARLDRARELDHERRAARAVVRPDEAGQVLRVVVRADDNRP